MRYSVLLFSLVVFFCTAYAFSSSSKGCPELAVSVKLANHTFKQGENIYLVITLTNKSKKMQSVWFDRPKSSTGGPAFTSVMLINKKTGRSVLKYQNRAILSSQLYSPEQVEHYSYHLKQGESISGKFSLYDLVVLLNDKTQLSKGSYEMQLFYCENASEKLSFTVN